MARRLPPSSSLSSSLTILSHLLARMLDEAVASTASALRIRPRFFEGGFGDLKIVDFSKDELVASLSKFDQEKRRRFAAWVEEAERGPVLELKWTTLESGYRDGVPYVLKETSFETPALSSSVARALPEASRVARARLLTPAFGPFASNSFSSVSSSPALYVHLAGTGDHGFDRRLRLGAPLLVPPGRAKKREATATATAAAAATLLKEKQKQQQRQHSSPPPPPPSSALSGGIATLALESPFYGSRRPHWQSGAKLAHVSDLIALGRATIEEALALLRWAAASGFGAAAGGAGEGDWERGGGGGLGVTGLSMGGVHAAMVAALAPGPLAAVPMLAPRSAAAAFCRGALWRATAWEPLVERRERVRGGEGGGGGDGGDAVLEALLAAAAVAPPGSGAAKVAEALAAGGWPLSALATPTTRRSSSSSSSEDGKDSDRDESASAATAASAAAREALEHVLETYTDITRFPPPPRRDAAIIVGAEADAYVSRAAVEELARHWGAARGGGGEDSGGAAEVRWVPGGHVSAFLSQGGAFREALRDAMERLALPAPPSQQERQEQEQQQERRAAGVGAAGGAAARDPRKF